jgi:simple sugar transport system permease protein
MTNTDKKDIKKEGGSSLAKAVNSIGLPLIIIGVFCAIVLIWSFIVGLPMKQTFSDALGRFGMWGLFVLSMIPSIQAGMGPNFALPIGIECGLLGLVFMMNMGLLGIPLLLAASALAIAIAVVVGYFYGRFLNAIKGSEMSIATYVGFSICAVMSLVWYGAPFRHPNMGWMLGQGLRQNMATTEFGIRELLDKLWTREMFGIKIPTGTISVVFVFCVLMWLFFRSKTGVAISAGGSNPEFALASGLDHNRNRIIANILTTVLAALGMIMYTQSYGFVQIYDAPMYWAFPAVAAILIGGATVSKAKVRHVIIGTFLYQLLMTSSMPLANEVFSVTILSDIMRQIIQNGVILYALTQAKRVIKT